MLHRIDCFALLITSRRVFFVRLGDLDRDRDLDLDLDLDLLLRWLE